MLFIGRFDRQKGLDRMAIGGKNVVKLDFKTHKLAPIAELIEPPATTNDALNAIYKWVNVLLLPSYWESLPLTVLETMRLGVVVCASDVGAMAEAIDNRQIVFFIPSFMGDAYVDSGINIWMRLSEDRPEVRRLWKLRHDALGRKPIGI